MSSNPVLAVKAIHGMDCPLSGIMIRKDDQGLQTGIATIARSSDLANQARAYLENVVNFRIMAPYISRNVPVNLLEYVHSSELAKMFLGFQETMTLSEFHTTMAKVRGLLLDSLSKNPANTPTVSGYLDSAETMLSRIHHSWTGIVPPGNNEDFTNEYYHQLDFLRTVLGKCEGDCDEIAAEVVISGCHDFILDNLFTILTGISVREYFLTTEFIGSGFNRGNQTRLLEAMYRNKKADYCEYMQVIMAGLTDDSKKKFNTCMRILTRLATIALWISHRCQTRKNQVKDFDNPVDGMIVTVTKAMEFVANACGTTLLGVMAIETKTTEWYRSKDNIRIGAALAKIGGITATDQFHSKLTVEEVKHILS